MKQLSLIIILIQVLQSNKSIIHMSSIIDDEAFVRNFNSIIKAKSQQKQEAISTLLQKFIVDDPSIFVRQNKKTVSFYSKIDLHNEIFMTQFSINLKASTIRILVYLLEDSVFTRLKSKHNQILLIKQLIKRDKQIMSEAKFFVQNSRVALVINSTMLFTQNFKKLKFQKSFKSMVIKNVIYFQNAMHQYLKIGKNILKNNNNYDNVSQFKKQLFLSQALSTTNGNFDMSEEKTQFKLGYQSLEKLKHQIIEIQQNVKIDTMLEASGHYLFYINAKEFAPAWIRTHLKELYDSYHKKYKSLMKMAKPNDKSIQQFIYNMIKAEIKEMYAKPIGEGGFSQIYIARATLTFISSTDHTVYSNNGKQMKLEKILAIKKMKSNSKIQMEKLQHQKIIIEKLRGSCCAFIPKYYGTTEKEQFNNCLLMEYIQGEELDSFLASKLQTISLWTKIYILLNVVYGIRHLINYSIIHLDLKPINILVCKFLIIKIIDYGEAYHKDVCNKNYCPGFSFPYASPEVYQRYSRLNCGIKEENQLQFSEKQDVFAFGVIMFEVIFDSKMFNLSHSKFGEVHTHKSILERVFIVAEILQNYGDDTIISTLAALILRCLDPDPKRRPKFEWICITLKLILNSYSSSNNS